MALVVPQSGEILMLQYIVGKVEAGNIVLHMFTNDIEPSKSTVIGDLVECTAVGYAPITLLATDWSVDVSTGLSAIVYPEQVFTLGAASKNYGLYLTDTIGNLLCVERFASVYETPTGGGKIYVDPGLTLRGE